MRPILAYGAFALMGAAAWSALLAPWPLALALAFTGFALAPRRAALAGFAATTLALDVVLYGCVATAAPDVRLGAVAWGRDGAGIGALVALRLVASLAAAAAITGRLGLARMAEGLRLPPRSTATVAAVLLAAQDVADDARRRVLARRLDGAWPRAWSGRLRAAAGFVPGLLHAALARATTRRDALRLAGIDVPAWWAPFVATAALATAGRYATLAVPNVALTFVVVFLGGMLFGAAVAATAGALAMLLSDLAFSGLLPSGLVNVPAMAAVGALGAALRRIDWGHPGQRAASRLLAAIVGVLATLAFSVLADVATWAIVPEARAQPGALPVLVLAGLAFNVVPAVANGVLFAVAVPDAVAAQPAVRQALPGGADPVRARA